MTIPQQRVFKEAKKDLELYFLLEDAFPSPNDGVILIQNAWDEAVGRTGIDAEFSASCNKQVCTPCCIRRPPPEADKFDD